KRRSGSEVAEDEGYYAELNKEIGETEEEAIADYEPGSAQDPQPEAEAEASSDLFGKPQISSGEERVDLDAAQDAEDEASEKEETTELTHADVQAAAGAFTKKFGVARGVKEIPVILGCGIMEIPKTQEALRAACEKLWLAVNAPTPLDEVVKDATIEEARAAILRYAEMFDGTTNMRDAPVARADVAAISKEATGFDPFSNLPKDPKVYGKLVASIDKAIASNRFGRTVKVR